MNKYIEYIESPLRVIAPLSTTDPLHKVRGALPIRLDYISKAFLLRTYLKHQASRCSLGRAWSANGTGRSRPQLEGGAPFGQYVAVAIYVKYHEPTKPSSLNINGRTTN